MRYLQVGIGMLALMVLMGCPSEFGKDGRINKAAHKDAMELVIKRCSSDKIEEVCGNGRQNSDECLKCLGQK